MKTLDNTISVSVCISAYNHQDFIEDAVNSVLEQECDFDFEIILSNDKSSDKTHEVITNIIKNHPNSYKIRYYNQEKNLGMMPNLIFTIEQSKGKYIALLEGDDFWVDKSKLQKQYDFLEGNPDYTICTGGLKSYIPGEGIVYRKFDEDISGITYKFDKMNDFRPNYLNMFFRKKSLDLLKLSKFKYAGDNVIFLMVLAEGHAYFFNEILGFRRTHAHGLWTSKPEVERRKFDYNQISELYAYPEYRNAIRDNLFYVSLDLLGSEKNNSKYIVQSFKLIKNFKEFKYFIKRILKFYLKL